MWKLLEAKLVIFLLQDPCMSLTLGWAFLTFLILFLGYLHLMAHQQVLMRVADYGMKCAIP